MSYWDWLPIELKDKIHEINIRRDMQNVHMHIVLSPRCVLCDTLITSDRYNELIDRHQSMLRVWGYLVVQSTTCLCINHTCCTTILKKSNNHPLNVIRCPVCHCEVY